MAALVGGVAAIAVILARGGGDYRVNAEFLNAGQLVTGNLVQVAGEPVGKVRTLSLTDDGRARVTLTIDSDHAPLHRGTTMRIRQVGLSGIANRYIEVVPGADGAPEIPDGGTLTTQETQGIVDLDMLLDELRPPVRRDIQQILIDGAHGLHGNARAANRALAYLDPAVSRGRDLMAEIVRDQAAVDRLVGSSAEVVAALGSRRDAIESGISGTAGTLEAIASERSALERTLVTAPGVLSRSRSTLRGLRSTLRSVRPALREARPSAPRLATVLRRLVPTARRLEPVIAQVGGMLAPLRRTLRSLPPLVAVGLPAVRSATTALRDTLPIAAGLRPYAMDTVAAVLGPGRATGFYDANGGFGRYVANVSPTETSPAGIGGLFAIGKLPTLAGLRTGLTARCPGAAAEPASDRSNPVHTATCDPRQDKRP